MQKALQTQATHHNQSKLTLIAKVTSITIVTVALFAQDLLILFNDALLSEATSYILAIPIIFTYLIYRKRKMLKATITANTSEPPKTKRLYLTIGILLCTLAIVLYWFGSYSFTPIEYHLTALPFFITGLTLILFNPQTLRQLAFPITFLAFLIPPPAEILYSIGATLSTLSAQASHTIITAIGIPATLTENLASPEITVTRPDGASQIFSVDIACSGIYSLIGFLIFAVFITYIIRDKPWKKLALLLLGLPLIYLLNITRITTMLLIYYQFDVELALQAFHLLGGWMLIFLGTLLLLLASEKIFKTQIFTQPIPKCPKCNPQPNKTIENFCLKCGRILKIHPPKPTKQDIIKIIAITLSTTLIIFTQAPVFALTQNISIDINTPYGPAPSAKILPITINGYNLHPNFTYRDTEFEKIAKQDMAIIYLYTGEGKEPLFVAIEIASTRSSLHRWETCLITWRIQKGWQPIVHQIDLRDAPLLDNPPIIARFFIFQHLKTNETQAVLYWYETAIFKVNGTQQQKYVKISLEAFPSDTEDIETLEDTMLKVAKEIAQYWQPIKLWSQIALLLSLNGDKLVATTTTILIAVIIITLVDRRRTRKTNYKAYQKLSTPNKQLIDAVHQSTKPTKHTPHNLVVVHRKITAKLKQNRFPKTLQTILEQAKTKTSPITSLLFKRTDNKPIATLENIATTYKKTSGKPIRKQKLLEWLRQTENIGLITSSISNKQDEPIQTWKPQIAFPKKPSTQASETQT
ncbi:MAG: exosortase/archaeosortase family protein [Candidatus Bathyarchaeia archaeon]|jgi:exosortase|nr:exosortase/archaeosortase family protein [Candidatus Bathyarchaeota archaeon A05DMB-4]